MIWNTEDIHSLALAYMLYFYLSYWSHISESILKKNIKDMLSLTLKENAGFS